MNRKIPIIAAILIFVAFLLLWAFKLAFLALGVWLVYLGIQEVRLDAFDAWTVAKFVGGALALYIGFAFKFRLNFKFN